MGLDSCHKASYRLLRVTVAMGSGRGSVRRLSGLQKDVLSLYRGLLRAAALRRSHDGDQTYELVQREFRKKQSWPWRDFESIERFVEKGKQKLQLLQRPNTQTVTVMKIRRTGDG